MQVFTEMRSGKKKSFTESLVALLVKELKLHRSKCVLRVYPTVGLTATTGATAGVCDAREADGTIALTFDSKLNQDDMILSFVHEMIHVKQMARGHLRYVNGVPHWLGKSAAHYSYENAPWEILAYAGMEKLLINIAHRIIDSKM